MKFNGESNGASVKCDSDSNDRIKGNTIGVKVIKTPSKFGKIENRKEAEVDHGTIDLLRLIRK
jgi:hypothetical protein